MVVCTRCGMTAAIHAGHPDYIFKGVGQVLVTINGETNRPCDEFQAPESPLCARCHVARDLHKAGEVGQLAINGRVDTIPICGDFQAPSSWQEEPVPS